VIAAFNGIGWLILFLIGLAILQRRVHFEFQAIFLLLTKHIDFTILLFSITFLPGVFLHELSHFIMAKLLRVPTGKFSILPKPLAGGRLQLGYVETSNTDVVRDALIGFAPLLAGTAAIAYISFFQLNISSILNMSGKISLELTMDNAECGTGFESIFSWIILGFRDKHTNSFSVINSLMGVKVSSSPDNRNEGCIIWSKLPEKAHLRR